MMSAATWLSKWLGSGLTLERLDDALLMQLRDLYSAEEQLVEALPKMADAASSPDLKQAFRSHLEETRGQKKRLEQIGRVLGKEVDGETCEAMKGLIAEGDEIINSDGDADVKDAVLIAAAQRVEHYEMAAYGCARTFARRLGRTQVADLLQQSLDEEGNADKILTDIAESFVNAGAARA